MSSRGVVVVMVGGGKRGEDVLEVQAGSSREAVARYGGARHGRGAGRGWQPGGEEQRRVEKAVIEESAGRIWERMRDAAWFSLKEFGARRRAQHCRGNEMGLFSPLWLLRASMGGPRRRPHQSRVRPFPPGLCLPEAKEPGLTLFCLRPRPTTCKCKTGPSTDQLTCRRAQLVRGFWGHGASSQARLTDSQLHCLDSEV